jgi:flagellar hook-length control protein FliK
MNAIPTVSRAPIHIDPATTGDTASADSAARSAGGHDFAAALSNAGSKPARKPAANKAQSGGPSGGQLPASGNPSPPPKSPQGAAVAPASAAGVAGGGTTGGTPGGTSSTPGGAAAPGLPMIASAQAQTAAPDSPGAPLDTPDAASALAAAAAAGPAGTAPAGPAAAGPGAVFGQVLGTLAANPQTGAQSADPAALGAPAPVRGAAAAGIANRPTMGVAVTAATAANSAVTGPATSATSAADSNPPPVAVASAGSDATAQTATAAAMAAAATGVAASSRAGSTDGAAASSSADDLAAAAAGSAAQAAAAANGAPVPAPAVSVIRAAAAAVATAAANAAAAAKPATAGVSDKRALGGTAAFPLSPASGDAAAAAAFLSANAAGAADAAPAPTLKVSAGVDTPEFGQGLAERVSWMVDNNLNGAKLQVNPPQLGPIEVRISVQGDHAQVWLASHSALTRDALESSSPKLREMLGAQGFGQVSVDISQRSFQERSPQAQPYDWTPAADRNTSTAAVASAAASMPRTSSGAVDAYA